MSPLLSDRHSAHETSIRGSTPVCLSVCLSVCRCLAVSVDNHKLYRDKYDVKIVRVTCNSTTSLRSEVKVTAVCLINHKPLPGRETTALNRPLDAFPCAHLCHNTELFVTPATTITGRSKLNSYRLYGLVAWSSGRTSVFGRCAFAVLRSTCS